MKRRRRHKTILESTETPYIRNEWTTNFYGPYEIFGSYNYYCGAEDFDDYNYGPWWYGNEKPE